MLNVTQLCSSFENRFDLMIIFWTSPLNFNLKVLKRILGVLNTQKKGIFCLPLNIHVNVPNISIKIGFFFLVINNYLEKKIISWNAQGFLNACFQKHIETLKKWNEHILSHMQWWDMTTDSTYIFNQSHILDKAVH